ARAYGFRWKEPREAGAPARRFPPGFTLLLVCTVFYTGMMIYIGANSVVTFNNRLFYPVFPFALCLIGVGLTRLDRRMRSEGDHRIFSGALAAMTAAYVIINARDTLAARPPSMDQRIEARLRAPGSGA